MNSPLFCDRCLIELFPGRGDFYVINVSAIADPTPPQFDKEPPARDLRKEINKLVRQMENMTAQEALDQVHRRLTLYLCRGCFEKWIEDPVGGERNP